MTVEMGAATLGSASLDSFAAELETTGMSPQNVAAHRQGVERFAEFVAPASPEQAGPTHLEAFVAYLRDLGVSESSLTNYRTVLTRWLDHVARSAPAGPTAVTILEGFATPEDAGDDATVFLADAVEPMEAEPPPVPVAVPGATAEEPTGSCGFEPVPPPRSLAAEMLGERTGPVGEGSSVSPVASAVESQEATGGMSPSAAAVPEAPQQPAPGDATGSGDEERVPSAAGSGFELPDSAAAAAAAFSVPGDAEAVASTEAGDPGGGSVASDPLAGAPLPTAPAVDTPIASGEPSEAAGAPASPPPMPDATFGGGADGGRVDGQLPTVPLGDEAGGIPLATVSEEEERSPVVGVAANPVSAAQPPPRVHEESPMAVGWSVRRGGKVSERLDLAEVRDMAVRGELSPHDQIRGPGGEWTRAGGFAPLAPAFRAAVERAEKPAAAVPELLPVAARAACGAVGGTILGALAWWLGAVALRGETAAVAPLLGVLPALLTRVWTGGAKGATTKAAVLGAPVAFVLGRYLVWATLQSGVVATGSDLPTAAEFARQAFQASWLGLLGAGMVLGVLIGMSRRGA